MAEQSYQGCWELIAADNGSVDDTVRQLESCQSRLPIRIVDASHRRGANAARNEAASVAKGDLLVFCDADDVVEETWLSNLVETARQFDLVGGRLDEETLNVHQRGPMRPRMPTDRLPLALDFLPFATFANLAIWAEVFGDLGGFDERYLFGNDDVELCFRAQLRGYGLGFAADAVVQYRHRPHGRGLFRQFYRYGRNEPLLYETYRVWGMPRPTAGQVVRRWGRLVLETPLARSPEERGRWLVIAGFSAGRLVTAVRRQVPYL